MLKKYFLATTALLSAYSTFAQTVINPDSISIVRDKWGVAHIFAKTDAEVAYGLAWANAEDNFVDMQKNMLQGISRLGAATGKDGAIRDFLGYSLRIKETVDEHYDDLTPEFKKYIDGYAAGINAYAKAHPKEVLYKKALPVTAKEILMGYAFTNSLISFVHSPIQNIIKGGYDDSKTPFGSNAFALNSSKTADGATYLACNPHQPFEGQMSFYETHLCSEEGLNVLGALFPGGSSVFIGSNENLGWTHTFNGLDLVDTYKLKMHPKKKYYYEYDGQWKKLEVRTIWLKAKVKGMVFTVPKKVYWSVYGATFKSDWKPKKAKNGKRAKATKEEKALHENQFYSVRFGANQNIKAAQQWYYMNKATNFADYHKACSDIGIVRFNFVYADRDDNIFYLSNGLIPKRNKGYDWNGVLPGNTSKTLWTEFYPLDSLPQLLNPACGFVFNTNNSEFFATDEGCNLDSNAYSRDMGLWYANNNRAHRLKELLDSKPKFNFSDFKEIKFDQTLPTTGPFAQSLKPLFESVNIAAYPDLSEVKKKLLNWNYSFKLDNKDAAVMSIAIHDIFKRFHWGGKELERPLVLADSVFADALRKSRDKLVKMFGTIDIPLGDYQRLIHGKVDLPVGGINDVLAATYTDNIPDGREMAIGGDTYIQMVKFNKTGLPYIESLLPLGNSCRPDSPHYTDQMELYSKQQTKVMTLDKATIYKEAERIYHPKK